MNERIQALANEAEDYADSIVDQGGEFHPAYTQKFAELIVRECVRITDKCSTGPGIHDLFADEIIAEHFGVE